MGGVSRHRGSIFPSGKILWDRWPNYEYSSRSGRFLFHSFKKAVIFPIGKMRIANAREFGAAVARARKALDLTQRDLALAIGTGERFIVELEAGKPTAQLEKALAAARAVGLRLTA